MPEEPRKRTTDERIDAIAMNLELFSHQLQGIGNQLQDLGNQVGGMLKNTTRNFELALDSIKRLENIALAHAHLLDEHGDRIEKLEDGK